MPACARGCQGPRSCLGLNAKSGRRMSSSPSPNPRGPSIGPVTLVAWILAIFMACWWARCAAFALNQVKVSGEIVHHEVKKQYRRRCGSHEVQYVQVQFKDEQGALRQFRSTFHGNLPADRRVAVAYARHQPSDVRLQGWWPLWGLCSMSSAVLLLMACLGWLGSRARGLDWNGRPLKPAESPPTLGAASPE